MKKIIRGLVMLFSVLMILTIGANLVMAAEIAEGSLTDTDNAQNVGNEVISQAETDVTEASINEEIQLAETVNVQSQEVDVEATAENELEVIDGSTLSKDEKLYSIIKRSYSKCKVCKDIEDHKEHMAMDSRMREFLWDPEKYYASEEVDLIESEGVYEDEDKAVASEDEMTDSVSETAAGVDEKRDNELEPSSVPETKVEEVDAVVAGAVEEKVLEEANAIEVQTEEEQVPVTEMCPSEEEISSNEIQPTEEQNPAIENVDSKPDQNVESLVDNNTPLEEVAAVENPVQEETIVNDNPVQPEPETVIAVEVPKTSEAVKLDENSELDLLYRLVESEAGIESPRCKEMVTAVVLNRVKSEKFPNTIYGVIYAPGAFAVTDNNVIGRTKASQETINAVNRVYYGRKEMPDNVYFFRNNHYFSWCKPVTAIDNTYFSTFK